MVNIYQYGHRDENWILQTSYYSKPFSVFLYWSVMTSSVKWVLLYNKVYAKIIFYKEKKKGAFMNSSLLCHCTKISDISPALSSFLNLLTGNYKWSKTKSLSEWTKSICHNTNDVYKKLTLAQYIRRPHDSLVATPVVIISYINTTWGVKCIHFRWATGLYLKPSYVTLGHDGDWSVTQNNLP